VNVLLVPAHPGFPGQIPQSRKTVVCVTSSVDSKQNVDTIYLDFAKAFDKVPHQRLLLKLRAHGIDGAVRDWIGAWLRDRWQKVRLKGSCSSW